MLFRDSTRARFSLRKPHGRSPYPPPPLKSISLPLAQTSRIDPPTKYPLKYPASHNSQEARQPKTSRTSNVPTSNAPTSNAPTSNASTSNVQG